MFNLRKNTGKLNILAVLILTALVIGALGYFGINLRSVVDSETGQENISTIRDTITNVWENYLRDPVLNFWNNIWLPKFWQPFLENMEKIKNGEPTDIQSWGQNLMPN